VIDSFALSNRGLLASAKTQVRRFAAVLSAAAGALLLISTTVSAQVASRVVGPTSPLTGFPVGLIDENGVSLAPCVTDVLPLLAERLVLANGRLERAPIVVCRHRVLRSPQRAVAHSAATGTAEFAGVLVRRRACRRGWVLFARLRERPVRRASFPHTYTSCVNPCQHVSRVVAMCLLAS